ncbi:hypothetical protein CDAR_63871 [Caerostris darwini]|uniref:Uncharacterized protein n=1 Tax=Caerostris darwini TaxID=1538125 RepID=A0AAV4SFE3_9ARAC|nr:hypothetical protein CDAR_63871 [Caerostris darwini]
MLTEERGYVIYYASGSFYIPLIIMMVVYIKIFEAAKDRLRHKAKAAAKLAAMRKSPDTTSTIPFKSMQSEISTIAVTDESTVCEAQRENSGFRRKPSPDCDRAALHEGKAEDLPAEGEEGREGARHRDGGVRGILAALLPHVRHPALLRQLPRAQQGGERRNLAELLQFGTQPGHLHRF